MNQKLDSGSELLREDVRNFWIDASQHFLVETLHVLSPEWRFESNRLVEDAAERPNV